MGVAGTGRVLVLGLDRVDDALCKVGADLVAVGTDGCLEGVTREATRLVVDALRVGDERFVHGGRGLDGVVEKADGYSNPAAEMLEGEQ